jgi:hypothetical protein
MGFEPYDDQNHRVELEIPRATGLFDDGTLTVKLEVDITGNTDDESGGWGNIRLSSKSDCK